MQEKWKFKPGTTVTNKKKRGKKEFGSVTSWERWKLVTVMCAMNVAGNVIPPLFIFPRNRKSPVLQKDGPPNDKENTKFLLKVGPM